MTATLIRYNYIDRPHINCINPTVPLGTKYTILGFEAGVAIEVYGEKFTVNCYYATRAGDSGPGLLPVDVFLLD